MMITNCLVKVKEAPPYTPELEVPVLMNSLARATLDPKTGSYSFPQKLVKEVKVDKANAKAVADIIAGASSAAGVGVDQGTLMLTRCPSRLIRLVTAELITAVPSHNPNFLARNFTSSEISYCNAQPSPSASFAGRWAGKEAVFKSLNVSSKGAGAAMGDIEILANQETGAPEVILHGDAKKAAEGKGITKVLISLSHSEVRRLQYISSYSC